MSIVFAFYSLRQAFLMVLRSRWSKPWLGVSISDPMGDPRLGEVEKFERRNEEPVRVSNEAVFRIEGVMTSIWLKDKF
jgi:hypothetical protein